MKNHKNTVAKALIFGLLLGGTLTIKGGVGGTRGTGGKGTTSVSCGVCGGENRGGGVPTIGTGGVSGNPSQ